MIAITDNIMTDLHIIFFLIFSVILSPTTLPIKINNTFNPCEHFFVSIYLLQFLSVIIEKTAKNGVVALATSNVSFYIVQENVIMYFKRSKTEDIITRMAT